MGSKAHDPVMELAGRATGPYRDVMDVCLDGRDRGDGNPEVNKDCSFGAEEASKYMGSVLWHNAIGVRSGRSPAAR